ncbi:CHAT domain-containing protein [Aestuariibacter sp. A3R04]|uniref:CHAT domain-containing protein n=1 Tax=Aestuariibacter sp. A3R04 TaxID=2841571 RepID=UPI001C088887|nr:CHAT domain-containing protein [Aestuariibacter sp. A3R04]
MILAALKLVYSKAKFTNGLARCRAGRPLYLASLLLCLANTNTVLAETVFICGEEPDTWKQYYRVFNVKDDYVQCTKEGSTVLHVSGSDEARVVENLSFIDQHLRSSFTNIEDAKHQQLRHFFSSYQGPYLAMDIQVRHMLFALTTMDYNTSYSLAQKFFDDYPNAPVNVAKTVSLVYLESQFFRRRYDEVIAFCNRKRDDDPFVNDKQTAVFLTYCGFSRVLQGESPDTSQVGFNQLTQAFALIPNEQNGLLCAQIRNGLASYYRLSGDLQSTERELNAGLQCLKPTAGLQEEEMQDDLINNLAWVYRRQGNLPLYLTMLRASVFQHTHKLAPEKLAVSYANLGRAYYLVGDLQKAQRYYLQSLTYGKDNSDKEDYAGTLMYMARLKLALDEPEAGEYYLNEALTYISSEKSFERARVLQKLLETREHPEAFDEAEYLTAIDTITNTFTTAYRSQVLSEWLVVLRQAGRMDLALPLIENIETTDQHPLSVNLAIANVRLELLLAQPDSPQKSGQIHQVFSHAFEEIVGASTKFQSNEVGMNWLSQSRTLINQYLSYLLPSSNEADIETALMLSEHFASIMFRRHRMALASNRDMHIEGSAVGEDYAYYSEFGIQSLSFNQMLVKNRRWEQQILSSVVPEIQEGDFGLEQVRRFLGTERAMLKLFSLGEKDCAYLITKQYIEGTCDSANESISQWLREVLFRFHGFKTLYIMPEGKWRNVSFSALKSDRGARYLGQEMAIIRVMSLRDFFEDDVPSSARNNVVTFTNPQNPDKTLTPSSDAMKWRAGFPSLPWTAMAIQSIAEAFPEAHVLSYNGEQATDENLMSDAARYAKLLHVGSHAYYSPENPDVVGIVTASDGREDRSGFVPYEMLFSKTYHNDLVVISACETEMGKAYQGIGMRSLSHGYLYQGAGATISTLWKVPDRATAEFMALFYAALSKNEGNIAEAMLEARQNLVRHRRFQDPRYWAGFVLTVTTPQYERLLL